MKKEIVVIIILILSSNFVLADIGLIGPEFSVYNLGDTLKTRASLISEKNLIGTFKTVLNCQNKTLDYFTIPIELKANLQEIIDLEDKIITKEMLGSCVINAAMLEATKILEETNSDSFEITNELVLDVNIEKTDLLPGEQLIINGKVTNKRNELIKSGLARLTSDKDYTTEISDGSFSTKLITNINIKSGENSVNIVVQDDFDNTAESVINFNVIPIPTALKNRVNKLELSPKETLNIEALLYDQANELMTGKVGIILKDPKRKTLLDQEISTNELLEYIIPDQALPGEYTILTSSNGIDIKSFIAVRELIEASFSNDRHFISITNLGNVVYNLPVRILLNEIHLEKETAILPGETAVLDLSKEDIPDGTYTVVVSSKNKEATFENVNIVHQVMSFREKTEIAIPFTGKAVLGSADDLPSYAYYLGLTVIILLLLYLSYSVYNRYQSGIANKIRTRDMIEAQKARKTIEETKQQTKKYDYPFVSKEQIAQDFRSRIVKEAEERQKRKEQELRKSKFLGYMAPPPKKEEVKKIQPVFDDSKKGVTFVEKKEEEVKKEEKKKKDDEDMASGFSMFK